MILRLSVLALLVCLEAPPPNPLLRKEGKKNKPHLDVIVLDAGHGGKDAGAIGTNGYFEKQATLAIVRTLGALIEKEIPGVKVVYTRKDDRFIELYRRGEIANELHAKLFISVHCNSTPAKPSNAT